MKTRNVKLFVEINVPYDSYDTDVENQKADKHIKKWFMDLLKTDSKIPIYIRKFDGHFVEDMSKKIKVKKIG